MPKHITAIILSKPPTAKIENEEDRQAPLTVVLSLAPPHEKA